MRDKTTIQKLTENSTLLGKIALPFDTECMSYIYTDANGNKEYISVERVYEAIYGRVY